MWNIFLKEDGEMVKRGWKMAVILLVIGMMAGSFSLCFASGEQASAPAAQGQAQIKDDPFCGLQGEQIGEYHYDYWYMQTKVHHNIKEYYNKERGIRMVILEKETRKGDKFVKLPHSLWITKDGYPPLSTDTALKNPKVMQTIYYAGLPTVQSQEHVKIFDDSMREGLKELGIDYDQLAKSYKERPRKFPATGFVYIKNGTLDPELLKAFEQRVLKAYARVLEAPPKPCPIAQYVEEILGPRSDMEYYLFKNEGFEVPYSGQKAFFTMMLDFREAQHPEK